MADRYVIEGRSKAINNPNLMILPSKNLQRYEREVDSLVKQMAIKEHFDNGLMFMQGYVGEKGITFYEMGARLGGTWPFIDEYYHKVNPLDMLFCHTLTGKMLPSGVDTDINATFPGMAGIIYFKAKNNCGHIEIINGIDAVKELPYVVSVLEYYHEGDDYSLNRLNDVLLLAVHLVANDFSELKERINNIYGEIEYLNAEGESILSPVYDVEKLEGYEQ